MADSDVLRRILQQVDDAKAELDGYPPARFGWFDRATLTAKTLIPWLVEEAPGLRTYVEEVLNSPSLLRTAWAQLKRIVDSPAEIARIDELLDREAVLLKFVAGDTVSIVVTGHLLARFPNGGLAGNSKSDYPDVFIRSLDYSKLPVRNREDKEIGAAIRGKLRNPVRVPDGLEIKTARNGASIDCHYPHVGLHLMLSFVTTGGNVVVDDVLVSFLRKENYRIASRKTEATTVKASFGRSSFISLLPAPASVRSQPARDAD
jgi:hypothetical protein